MTAIEQFEAAEQRDRDAHRQEWSAFNDALKNCDGRRAHEFGRKLRLDREQILAALQLSELSNRISADIASSQAELKDVTQRIEDGKALVSDAAIAVKKALAEKARIEADQPSEIAAYKRAAEVAVVAIDKNLSTRGRFLQARGWRNMRAGYVHPSDSGINIILPEAAFAQQAMEDTARFKPEFFKDWGIAAGMQNLESRPIQPAVRQQQEAEPVAQLATFDDPNPVSLERTAFTG